MRWLRRLLLLALIVGVMVVGWRFASENQQPVSVDFVFRQTGDVPLWQVILVSFGTGAGLVALFTLFGGVRNGLARRRYRKAIGGLEAEIHQLRNLPLAPDSGEPHIPIASKARPSRQQALAPEPDSPGGSPPVGALPMGGASGRNG